MASLQARLDKAFGALTQGVSGQQPAWRPSEQQVFRAGAPVGEAGDSSEDEEYREKQRRESVPGLAQALVDEDEPDAEGFRPSTAFCRALDAEDEYNDIDEVATGMISRRHGDMLPPRSTQVLEDNVYEQMSRQRAQQAAATLPAPAGIAEEQQPADMEIETPAVARAPATAAGGLQQDRQAGSGPAAAAATAEGRPKKSVRFEDQSGERSGHGLYVPPVRRPGYQQRFTELPPAWTEEPDSEDEAQGGAFVVLGPNGRPEPRLKRGPPPGVPAQQQQRRGASLSQVPDHVQHPEKYTCYVLDEPLVVGGGVGQLRNSQVNERQGLQGGDSVAAATAASAQEAQKEPERWVGPVGAAGSIQFKPRQQRTGGSGDAAAADTAAGSGSSTTGGAAPPPARKLGPLLRAVFEEDEAAEDQGAAGDVAMQDTQPAPTTAATKFGRRSYRSSRAAADHTD